MHLDELMSKAFSRMYIIRICKYYGFSRKELDLLFHSLILFILIFGIEVWGCASISVKYLKYTKYLSQVDKLLKRAYKYGSLMYQVSIVDILNNKDRDLWEKITKDPNHALQVLLPPSRQLELRNRGHEYELPRVRTERFKRVFVNRCLFNFI